MTLARLQCLLDVWGSDPNRWPAKERAYRERMLADPVARALLDEAHALDGALYRSESAARASVDDQAVGRVLAGLCSRPLPKQRPPLLCTWWSVATADRWVTYPRVAALACGATLGVMVGLSSFGLRMTTSLDLGLVQTATAEADLSGNVFDADSVTGLRP